jgi:hypothetical protein
MDIYLGLSVAIVKLNLATEWLDKARFIEKLGFNKVATTLNKIVTACNPKV